MQLIKWLFIQYLSFQLIIFWIVKLKKEYNFQKKKQIKIILQRKNNDKKLEKKIMGDADEDNLIEKNIEYLNLF